MRFLHACAMALFACALAIAPLARADDGLRIAVTIDDLPWVNLNPLPGEAAAPVPAHVAAAQAELLAALKASDVPVVGFVNCGKLYAGTTELPERMSLLERWRDAGIELGNHTGFHSDLHKVGLAAFETDTGNCDADLRRWFPDTPPRWFRHPFLHTGMNAADKAADETYIAGLGERIAPVTVAADDWTWALAYRKALADGDAATQAKLREAYVGFTLMTLRHFEIRAKRLLGRPLPQILLIHASELNADAWPQLAAALARKGERFVSLDDAMQDEAYKRPDTYFHDNGASWLYRWAEAERQPWTFAAGEPTIPDWVQALVAAAPP
ncbi:MAG TPA: polysaccharide deacetylase family protein [Lysobacter sp.]|nr:polysaccharide deacetylase family protein [Lysobacter sp.]